MKGNNPLFSRSGLNKHSSSKYAKNQNKVVKSAGYQNKAGMKLIKKAKSNDTVNYIKEIYRSGGKIGNGSLVDALKHERQTGQPVGKTFHTQKAKERLRQAQNVLRKNPNHIDKKIWKSESDKIARELKKGNK